MTEKKSQTTSSEKQIPTALDKCIADGIIKVGSGVVTGGILSLILFKRRFWPITMGIGVGLGMAMSNCQNKLNSTDVVRRNLGGK